MADQVVSTIYSLVKFLYQWYKDYQDSNKALGTMMSTLTLVETVIKGINAAAYVSLETPLRALMDCLNETKDMLIANSKKIGQIKQFLFPAGITAELQVVDSRIHRLVSIMTLAVSTTHLNVSAKSTALDFIKNEETKKFWQKAFGIEVYSVRWADLEKALMTHYSDFIDAEALSDLRLRLDNLATGYISCHRLSDFCGDEALSKRLRAYTQKKEPATPLPIEPDTTEVKFPLLLWVDDNPGNNRKEIEYAKNRGIQVVELNSTSAAKQWIAGHPKIMEEGNPTRFRIITDNAREGAGTTLDINAGEDMIRFVRGRRSKVPILVYCGNLEYTKYTANYKECTAVNKQAECTLFISHLK